MKIISIKVGRCEREMKVPKNFDLDKQYIKWLECPDNVSFWTFCFRHGCEYIDSSESWSPSTRGKGDGWKKTPDV